MFLDWITQLVKAAVLKGFHEAAEELQLDNPDENPLDTLKTRIGTKQLAATTEKKKPGKAAA